MIEEGMKMSAEVKAPEPSLLGIHKRITSAQENSARLVRMLDVLGETLFGGVDDAHSRIVPLAPDVGDGLIALTYEQAIKADRLSNEAEVMVNRLIDRLEIRGAFENRMKPSAEIR